MTSNGIIDPTSGQSEPSIGRYLGRWKIGDEVAIRETQGGALSFVLTTITVIKLETGRVYTDDSGYGGGALGISTMGEVVFTRKVSPIWLSRQTKFVAL